MNLYDVDILVEFIAPSVSLFTLLNIKHEIEEKLRKDVDIIHAPIDENALINPTKVLTACERPRRKLRGNWGFRVHTCQG